MRVSPRIPEGQRFQCGQFASNSRFEIVCLPPERGFEPRTLRLTDRWTPIRNGSPNSLRAAEYRQLARFISGFAVCECN